MADRQRYNGRPRADHASWLPPRVVAVRSAVMGTVCIGTSSWSEKSWEGVFYPAGMKPAGYLAVYAIYATRFDTVEADATYYRIPDQRTVVGWRDRTPDGFVLSAKFPRSIVHGGESERPDAGRLLLPEERYSWMHALSAQPCYKAGVGLGDN